MKVTILSLIGLCLIGQATALPALIKTLANIQKFDGWKRDEATTDGTQIAEGWKRGEASTDGTQIGEGWKREEATTDGTQIGEGW